MSRTRVALICCLPALFAACWQEQPRRQPLQVERTSPVLDDEAQPILLNDSLTVFFSAPLLPLSVTSDSVSVLDERGHQVPGSLQVGEDWVTFRPHAPLAPDLLDGSFRPGATYQLRLAGYPRPDALRSLDGTWLEAVRAFEVHVADHGEQPAGLPSLLRPPGSELPLMLRRFEEQLPADAPRLQLHFTQPLLPSSVTADAFEVRVLDRPVATLEPRSVRLVTSPIDPMPGCTVEIDLGTVPQRADGSRRPLIDGDWINVMLRPGGVCDLAGNPPFSAETITWLVVEGDSVPLCGWPAPDESRFQRDDLSPGFEVRQLAVRPRVRVEAGSGRLGVFRPSEDVTLRPGEPFDRGDGELVVSEGASFPFLSIDVPPGVTVTVDARTAPVQLLSVGGVRIAGTLRVLGAPTPLPPRPFRPQPVAELIAVAPVALVAAGGIELLGDIRAEAKAQDDQTPLLLATASRMQLLGALPFQTMLVAESAPGEPGASRIEGARGQSQAYAATFTYGVADGASFDVSGELPWRQLPAHVDAGRLQIVEPSGAIDIAWQAAPVDPIAGDRPDVGVGRVGRWQGARDGEVMSIGAGAFVRLELRCRVRHGAALPRLRELRVVAD